MNDFCVVDDFNMDDLSLKSNLSSTQVDNLINIILIISSSDWNICDNELDIITSFFSMYINEKEQSIYVEKTVDFWDKSREELNSIFSTSLKFIWDIDQEDKERFINWLVLLVSSDWELSDSELFYFDKLLLSWWMENYLDD